MMLRGHGQHGVFGNMGILRQVHDHAFSPDARGDAVDQRGQFVIVMDIGVEVALLLHHDFGAAGGQANEIEAEAGIEGIVERIEPLCETGGRSLLASSPDGRYRPQMVRTAPSVRKKLASSRRAPLPCLSIDRDQHGSERGQVHRNHGCRWRPVRGKRFSTM